MSEELYRQIEGHMRALKFKGMIPVYKEISSRAAAGNLLYEEYLALLLEEEVRRKTEVSVKRKIHMSRLPYQKTLEEFDLSYQPGLKEKEVIRLSSLDFIEQCAFFGASWGRQDTSCSRTCNESLHGEIPCPLYDSTKTHRRTGDFKERWQYNGKVDGILKASSTDN